jgi:hypothetical protein
MKDFIGSLKLLSPPLLLNHVLATDCAAAHSSVLPIRSFTSHSEHTAYCTQGYLKNLIHINPEDGNGSVCQNVEKPTTFHMAHS